MGAKRSSSAVPSLAASALEKTTYLDISERKAILVALANCSDNGFQAFRDTNSFLTEYTDAALLMFRDLLRMIWKPPRTPAEVPPGAKTFVRGPYNRGTDPPAEGMMPLWRAAIDRTPLPWDVPAEVGSLQEEILNFWLRTALDYIPPHRSWLRQTTSWRAVWTKARRGLVPNGVSLPAILVDSVLQVADRLRYCRNKQCANPYFVAVRRDQLYCSRDCAAPAKRKAKLKWWRREHAHDRLPSLALKEEK